MSNTTNMLFQVASSGDVGDVLSNTYTTLMTLSTVGNLTVNNTVNANSISTGNIFSTNAIQTNVTAGQLRFHNSVTSGILFGSGDSPVSRIYDDSQLHIWSDDTMYFDVGGASTSGTNRLFVNTTGVGIGNTTPLFNLDVTGTARFSNGITTGSLLATNVSTGELSAVNISTATLTVSGGMTTANLFATSITASSAVISNSTLPNIVSTNVSSGTYSGTSISVGQAIFTNTSSGSISATSATVPNIVSGSISSGVAVVTTYSGGALQISGSASIGGFDIVLGRSDQTSRGDSGQSRAVVKDTGNVLKFNLGGDFTGGVEVEGSRLLHQGFFSASGNSNTLGNIFTTGGNVGIRTFSPTIALDVTGTLGGKNTGASWEHLYWFGNRGWEWGKWKLR
jgi:hypothetical protein